MQLHRRAVLAVLGATIALCGGVALFTSSPTGAGRPSVGELASANNEFAFDLYGRLAGEPGNLCLSPLSIDMALAMARAGARGRTADQITRTLHLPAGTRDIGFAVLLRDLDNKTVTGNQLVLANSLWIQRGLPVRRQFRKTLRDQYGAYLSAVDFGASAETARQQINAWIASATHGNIEDMIRPGSVRSGTDLVVVSAVYFMGAWATPFDDDATRPLPFHLSSTETVSAPTMSTTGLFRYTATETMQSLEMPYASAAGERRP